MCRYLIAAHAWLHRTASSRLVLRPPAWEQGNRCFGAPLRHAGGRAGSAAGGIENDGVRCPAAVAWCLVTVPSSVVARLSRSTPCFAVTQDFGARDPFVGEIVTGFGNTPLGNADTMHNVK